MVVLDVHHCWDSFNKLVLFISKMVYTIKLVTNSHLTLTHGTKFLIFYFYNLLQVLDIQSIMTLHINIMIWTQQMITLLLYWTFSKIIKNILTILSGSQVNLMQVNTFPTWLSELMHTTEKIMSQKSILKDF